MNSQATRFRIKLGVTGHRVLKNQYSIALKIREVLNSKIYDLFNTNGFKEKRKPRLVFTILTPIAEGADRLVACEVLKFPDSTIEVVLPFTKEEYLKDFETEESKREFEELYRKAREVIVLNDHHLKEVSSTIDPAEARKKAYEIVGHHVVNHCDVLIALWDGRPSRGRGGTAEIVAYAREKKCPLIIISNENPENIKLEKGRGLKT
jgi:hypothetical protein